MIHKTVKCAFKEMPVLQDGDVIDGGNWSRIVVTDIPQNLTLRNNPNMFNCNLTGNITAEGNYGNTKKELCYWIHPNIILDVEEEDCAHVTNSYTLTDDEGHDYIHYEREDTLL